jgi:hypothetical protein
MTAIANPVASGRSSPDGLAYDVLTKIEEVITFLNSTPATFIVVSKEGSDSAGTGSFGQPYLTIAKAITVWTATRHTIYVLAGQYNEVALVWPSITGLTLAMLVPGTVSITNNDGATAVITIAPTWTASTFEATIIGSPTLGYNTQIGLKIANAAMTKKLNVYIDGLEMGKPSTSGDSIDIAGTVAGQAIRVYARRLNLQGLLHFTANDAGSRLRVRDSDLIGGITCAGSVAAESTLLHTQVLTSGLSIDGAWSVTNIGCVWVTNADPAVHTQFADAYSA